MCQKWDSNPRPHMWTRKPSATMMVEGSHPWVWRLRPLGHPDSGLWSSPLPFCSQTCKWRSILDVCATVSNRDSGVMVSIVAFQAVDRGSIPCCRICFFFGSRWQLTGKRKKQVSEVGFEPTPTFVDQNALGHDSGRRISSLSLAP